LKKKMICMRKSLLGLCENGKAVSGKSTNKKLKLGSALVIKLGSDVESKSEGLLDIHILKSGEITNSEN